MCVDIKDQLEGLGRLLSITCINGQIAAAGHKVRWQIEVPLNKKHSGGLRIISGQSSWKYMSICPKLRRQSYEPSEEQKTLYLPSDDFAVPFPTHADLSFPAPSSE